MGFLIILGVGCLTLAVLPGGAFAVFLRLFTIHLGHGIRLIGRIRLF